MPDDKAFDTIREVIWAISHGMAKLLGVHRVTLHKALRKAVTGGRDG